MKTTVDRYTHPLMKSYAGEAQLRCKLCNAVVGQAFEYDAENDESFEYFIPFEVSEGNVYCRGH